MAWDSSRPVPWKRLLMLFVVYAVVANVALLAFSGGSYTLGTVVGMLMGLGVYLAMAFVLVKFGWNPPALSPKRSAREAAERRAASAASKPAAPARPPADGPRTKPAPTRRTNATNRRSGSTSARRR